MKNLKSYILEYMPHTIPMVFKWRVIGAIPARFSATIELTLIAKLIQPYMQVPMVVFKAGKCRSTQDYTIRSYGIAIYCIPVYCLELILQMLVSIWLDIAPVAGHIGARDNLFDTTGNLLYCIGESYVGTNSFQ